jgi:hypothetical protein
MTRRDDIEADEGRGLADLLAGLRRLQVRYWIDSGVLLGLHRSGRLNPWEKDIDLAVGEDAVPRLLKASGLFEQAGYDVIVNRYRGRVYAIGLNPTDRRPVDDLRAAIHVYYEEADYLWSPQPQIYIPPPSPDVYLHERSWAGETVRRFIARRLYQSEAPEGIGRSARAPDRVSVPYRFARAAYRRLDRGLMAETWPVREVFVPLTWVVPRDLVLPLGSLKVDGLDFPVPTDVDGYLTYRYGDWRTPTKDWCYWEDDGAIVRARPQEVLPQLRAGTFSRG